MDAQIALAAARDVPAPAAGPPSDDLEEDQPWGDERPAPAQPGWYRLGRSFYREGEGPFPNWSRPEPAKRQLSLF